MDSKKQFVSLMEDDSPGLGNAALRPLSPVQNGCRLGVRNGYEGSTCATPPSPSSGLDNLDLDLTPDHAAPSCVTKETPQEDCARHRFIVWAAVKRNSSVRMTAQERLECPLLRCTKRFTDHESMLKHLAGCRYLASGEYWCYDHMRVERFDDLKCKRCLGHPSKRRKMLHMAKNFFNSLGHKSKKASGLELDDDDDVILPPPPSYDSLNIPTANANASELPSTEILEIDSMEVSFLQPTPMPAPSDVIDPQDLLMPTVPELPELDSTTLSYSSLMPWQTVPGMTPPSHPIMPQEGAFIGSSAIKPALQLATAGLQGRRQVPRPAPVLPRSKGLSPSSSVRSTASTETNASMMSNGSSLISPSSNWSGAWSMGSGLNTSMATPVDGVVADDMFADAMNSHQNDACPDFLHDYFSELPADLPMLDNAAEMASDGFLGFDAPPLPTTLSYAPEIVLPDEAVEATEIDESEVEQTNMCCSDTTSLVAITWDALQLHIVTSMEQLHERKANHVADQLNLMSARTIATTGLRTLRNLIDGEEPSSASDALCMMHIVTALALVLYGEEASGHCRSLFLQSLAYAHGLPLNDRKSYEQLVVSIWQPPDFNRAEYTNHPSFKGKGKAPVVVIPASGQRSDSLLNAARDFLDELEMCLLRQSALPLDIQISDLYMTHLKDTNRVLSTNAALLAAAKHALETLSQGFCDVGLDPKLRAIYQRLSDGSIRSVRMVEIEILQAGKGCLSASRFFDHFVPKTRVLCDQIYEQHNAVPPRRRNVYHRLGIALIESFIPEFVKPCTRPVIEPLDDIDEFFDDVSFDPGDVPITSTNDLQETGSQAFDFGLTQAQLPTSPATTSETPSSSIQTTSLQTFKFNLTPAQLPTPPATTSGTPSISMQRTNSAGEQAQQQQAATEAQEHHTVQKAAEAHSFCEICGYRPKGDPQWFKGSMAKHRKLQHSTEPPKIFKCPYPGCTSQYKNRPDNLRQHQIEKNHWVQGDEIAPRRPSKRKKPSDEE